jgi:hypothetical protein
MVQFVPNIEFFAVAQAVLSERPAVDREELEIAANLHIVLGVRGDFFRLADNITSFDLNRSQSASTTARNHIFPVA